MKARIWIHTIGEQFEARVECTFKDGDVLRKQGPLRESAELANADADTLRQELDQMVETLGGKKISELRSV